MKNNVLKKIFLFFIIAVIVQLGVIAFILCRSSSIKREAEKSNRIASFKCEMRDPYNPFKGRYVELTLSETDKEFSELDIQSREVKEITRPTPVVFCLLKKDVSGNFRISGLRANEPDEDTLFVRARMKWFYGDSVTLSFPFNEYYMQENYAREVDSLGSSFYDLEPRIEVYIDNHGNCIQKALYVNGNQAIEDYIKSLLPQRQL
ncbi:MAG: GDYXXLXY domain-containing protein [Treponema sp.]|nr:GDYXXLXY domain-containing protein [Treponema sp.]